MSDGREDRIGVELTTSEARLVVAALRQFEPYRPADMDDVSRGELLTEVRDAMERVANLLPTGSASTT